MERKRPDGVRFVHLDIFMDMTVQVYRYRLMRMMAVKYG